jgi:hypothetical protein
MCKSEGKVLAEIYSKDEQKEFDNFAARFSRQSNIWIGLTYNDNEKDFLWDFSRATPGFTNWEEGYPKKSNESKCVGVSNGKWRNINCNQYEYGVCQEGKKSKY